MSSRVLLGCIALSQLMLVTMMSMRSLPQENSVFRGNFSTEPGNPEWFKVLNWNINYGLKMEGIGNAIQLERPDIVLLQEVDVNASRTRRKNVAEELARRFSFNYVFGIEFEELAQGSKSNPAYHGQAILSRFPIRSSRILRFTQQTTFWQPRPYLPRWPVFQPRVGGRMALIAAIGLGDATVVFYNLHLESQGSEQLRMRQLDEVLADVEQYPSDACLILAGDFNTDVRSSPLAGKVIDAGFRNVVKEGSPSTKPGGAAKDWVFVRGPIEFDQGRVHQDVTASDHFPVTSYLSASCFEQKEKQQ